MAMKKLISGMKNLVNHVSGGSENVTTDAPISSSLLLDLPPELLQSIIEHLPHRDILTLTRTCRTLHEVINNDHFWIHRIRSRFPRALAQLYTIELFEEPEKIETYDEIRSSGFVNRRSEAEIDLAAIESATHYNDEALAKRHAKMYVSKEDFLEQVDFYQYSKPKAKYLSRIPLMQLVYFYMIDRKRMAIVNMSVIHRNTYHLVEHRDADSFVGRIIALESVCWLEIDGRMEHRLMPGKYEVSWRMKFRTGHPNIAGETEFLFVPMAGKLRIHTISENDFRTAAIEHGRNWFVQKMGHIEIYGPSTVFVAIRNWQNGSWKSGISWDCVELTLVP